MNTLQETVLLYLESNAHATRQLGNAAPINCRRRRRRRTLLLQTQARMCAIDKYDKNELLSSFFWIFQAGKQQPTVLKRVSCARTFVRSFVGLFLLFLVRPFDCATGERLKGDPEAAATDVCLSVCLSAFETRAWNSCSCCLVGCFLHFCFSFFCEHFLQW